MQTHTVLGRENEMGRYKTRYGEQLKKEVSCARFIPYTCHVDANTVKTKDGDYVQVLKVAGIAHETADTDQLNAWHNLRNTLYRSLQNQNCSVWTTIIRHESQAYPEGDYLAGFSDELNQKYRKSIQSQKLYVNDMYISLVLKAPFDIPILSAFFNKKLDLEAQHQLKALQALSEITQKVFNLLQGYEPERLALYTENDVLYSRVYEFFGHLINGEYQKVPLTTTSADQILNTSRLSFGVESFEIRASSSSLYGATIGIKEYTPQSSPGMLDHLLHLPCSFILTQSFTCISKSVAVQKMTIQKNKMVSAGDLAQSQILQITDALDDLISNEFVMGDHHLTMTVLASTLPKTVKSLSHAVDAFANAGFMVAREDLALEAGFWAQLPGNFSHRPRKALITSRNFAGLMSMHNHPVGHLKGNWWGDALTMFKTTSGTPYYFNFHQHGEHYPLGNTTIIGPSGTGKTVLMGFLMAQAEKYKPRVVYFDKDRGAEIFIRAQSGQYNPLFDGEPTGFNPLQLEPTPKNKAFLTELIKVLATSHGEAYSVEDAEEVNRALKGVLKLDKSERRLINLIPFLDGTRANSVASRLMPWVGSGEHAWVFDHQEDSLSLDSRLLGFDITEILNRSIIRTPVLFYLFHRIDELINGDKITIYIDEGWKAVDDPVFEPVIKDWLKTIRKREGLLVFGTQSAKDAAECRIGDSIIEQSVVNIFMPNPKATYEHYVEKFGLTEHEFEIVKNLGEKSRQFLIRKNNTSVVVELDLSLLKEDIPVLSGSQANVRRLDDIRAKVGDAPKDWLPKFIQEVS